MTEQELDAKILELAQEAEKTNDYTLQVICFCALRDSVINDPETIRRARKYCAAIIENVES